MNMIRNRIIPASIAAMCFLPTMGQETIVLKNGSRYMGHTSVEDYETNTVNFMVDSAIVVESLDDVVYSGPVKRRVEDLRRWEKWLKENPTSVFFDGDSCTWMGNISYNSGRNEFDGEARILALTDNKVTFLTINQANMTIDKIKDIDHYEYAPRDPLSLAGIIDEIVLDDGDVYSGQIVADYPSKLILLSDDGIRHEIKYRDIKMKRTLPYNANYQLSRQMPYFSQITLRTQDGSKKTVEGIILEKVYKPEDGKNPYYIVTDNNDRNRREYSFDDVVRIGLSRNNHYIKGKDIVLKNRNDMLIGSQPARNVLFETYDNRYSTCDSNNVMNIPADDVVNGVLKIHFKDLPENGEFLLVEARTPQNVPSKPKDKNINKAPRELYYASISDLLLNNITPLERFVSPNGNVALSYSVKPGKAYFLLRKADKTAYIILIEN